MLRMDNVSRGSGMHYPPPNVTYDWIGRILHATACDELSQSACFRTRKPRCMIKHAPIVGQC